MFLMCHMGQKVQTENCDASSSGGGSVISCCGQML